MSALLYTSCTSSLSSSASTIRKTVRASSAAAIGTRLSETSGVSAESIVNPASSSAWRTSYTADGSVVTVHESPSRATSSAPASMAASIRSSSPAEPSTSMTPRRLNCQLTDPGSASEPPSLLNTPRTSAPVRLRLSVSTSISRATPPGAYPSYMIDS